jgi:alpha-glucosidase
MVDAILGPQDIRDSWEKNVPGLGLGRDPARTPMRWSNELHGGFTTGKPWLPVDVSGMIEDRAKQREDARSMFSLYRALLQLRRTEPALAFGSFRAIAWADAVLVYQRQHDGKKFQIALNMSDRWQSLPPKASDGRIVISTFPRSSDRFA